MSFFLPKLKQQAPSSSTSTSSAPIVPSPANPITHSQSRYPNPNRRPRRSSLPAPAPPPDAPRVAVFGAGSRGTAYSNAIRASALARVVTVCEPRDAVREEFGRTFIWGADRKADEGEAWSRWEEWVEWERERRASGLGASVDIVFVCVLDEMHVAACKAVAGLGGIHVLCEKPLATSLKGCLDIWAAVRKSWEANGGKQTVFGIGHVLRYSPHNVLLRKLIREDKVIGDVVSIEHTEPIGWWHFTHSYVRGNWRKESTTAPSLLTKSCHDIDFLLWLLCSPNSGANEPPHLPSSITSSGSLRNFRRARKPIAAGDATNCLACPIESSCKSSALEIYWRMTAEPGNTRWPVDTVVPEIEDVYWGKGKEAGKARLMEVLAQDYTPETSREQVEGRNWFGRCVYESDNNVCDDQTVTISWEDDPLPSKGDAPTQIGNLNDRGAKTALFHMVSQTTAICTRRGRIYGTDGELSYNSSDMIYTNFENKQTRTIHVPPPPDSGHGGGDDELANNMVKAVIAVRDGQMNVEEAQWTYLGVDLEEIIRSHAAVFAAETARTKNSIVDWEEWWAKCVVGQFGDLGIK